LDGCWSRKSPAGDLISADEDGDHQPDEDELVTMAVRRGGLTLRGDTSLPITLEP
jgi:hypothetical protein